MDGGSLRLQILSLFIVARYEFARQRTGRVDELTSRFNRRQTQNFAFTKLAFTLAPTVLGCFVRVSQSYRRRINKIKYSIRMY
jgi:hypothetical protein